MVLVVSPAFLEQNGSLFIVEVPERNVFRGRRQPFSQCILDVHAGQVCIRLIVAMLFYFLDWKYVFDNLTSD